ncbi:BREX-1 system adenine-specific DNA-methyltransferase PglX [Pseudomonas sp. PDM26]|uniref:BREX-1 system adenine-specific DNA-methyltransferase PglX n=1 Tax=Pseudomonas sp. PDM26 TaxID=2854766 RepID=UPI001C43F82D|nr:BREX-1 system adenine-specific DNA-methyltransferase PglX [Pseudomonas sp. PDM26]MBV7547563.1 BREX-1 system adenine-specific DNA-methyltransferase PglX [Pseudomonas sp. PDM26]
METSKLKKFAQQARRLMLEQVGAKLALVLDASSAARRENPQAVSQLERQIANSGREMLIDKVAYTWFNRICALRFMDVNGYTRIRVVSPAAEGQFQPEILSEAKAGHIDEERVPEKIRQQIQSLLSGTAPSRDPQQEAYRLLVVAECNAFHSAMPYLFERIADYTELLMPDDLLSGNSILAYTREAMTPDVCKEKNGDGGEEPIVEVIGWLYQFYISERKDQVFEDLKKNRKITSENIPAATQLFTPHYIVRYLVENSLGRLWMLNHPSSSLAGQMDYYIKPEPAETNFLKISKPEDIKVCDPACGSGHMLTYAFDLLYAIYEEVGTDPTEIPEKILTHNLYGIELDERAGELAAFALTMKARAKQRRFFNKAIKPNICVLEKVGFSHEELDEYIAVVGRDLFTLDLRETLNQFEEADNFGSLIRPRLSSVQNVLPVLEAKDMAGNLFLASTHAKVLQVLRMADYLSPRHAVVIANPPYMGGKGMNARLGAWAKENYPSSKSDLFAMFIERNLDLAVPAGAVAMITMQSWMFLSSFESLRDRILSQVTLASMAHLGARAFDSIGGEIVSTTAFVLNKSNNPEQKGEYLRLVGGNSETEKDVAIREAVKNRDCGWLYRCSSVEFRKIPGSPIAYWLSTSMRESFGAHSSLAEVARPKEGLNTTDNDRFLRRWWECSLESEKFDSRSAEEAASSGVKWFPCQKGGGYRKWYGNNEYVVNWLKNGSEIKGNVVARYGSVTKRVVNEHLYFKEGITWSAVSSSSFAMRYVPQGHIFETAGSMCFFKNDRDQLLGIGVCNSCIVKPLLECVSPTLSFKPGPVGTLPIASNVQGVCFANSKSAIEIAVVDWNSYEFSWEFSCLPLLHPNYRQSTLKLSYQKLFSNWRVMTLEMQRLEEENNRIFIEAYGLQGELSPDVPIKEITLTCNPYYRYGGDKTKAELEAQLQADTMAEFLSYAVGCMFGRYSLDKAGLVLANQGDTLAEYVRKIPEPRFMPDEDNVIPLLDGEWFADDVTERFRTFLRVTFGEEHYEENLSFIEASLGKDVRKYFIKDFYTNHVKRYKKRPIYWLFASPKGTFSALIYLHRYRTDTVSVVLQYLRDFRKKLAARLDYQQQVGISTSTSQGEKTRALKEIETLKKQLLELDDYERDTLYPLATEQINLDLDDGVKTNYLKLGRALKKIVGLDAKGDE